VDLAFDPARRLTAIVIGRAGMDLYPFPDGVETESAEFFAAEIGGSAGNIAVALARQDCPVALLSVLSDDAVGRFVRRHLERYGVDLSRCRTLQGPYRSSLAICETRPTDSETVFYRNGAVDLQLNEVDVDSVFISSASFLVVTGTALAADPSRSAALNAIALARTAGVYTILDLDYRPLSFSSLDETRLVLADAALRCDAVVGNEEEFALLSENSGGGLEVARRLTRQSCQLVIYKRGAAGSITITREDTFETGIFPVDSKKPFGAGDAFLGSLIVGLHRRLSLASAVRRAAAAAAYVVARRGCAFAMPTSIELDRFIATYLSSPAGQSASVSRDSQVREAATHVDDHCGLPTLDADLP
jgi:5-dehydro-2-deoxygluconokinase